jgi:hypothetical protein
MTYPIGSLRKLQQGATSIRAITMASCMLAAIPVFAQSQDAARALNLFQQLLQPQKQNAAPAGVPVNLALPINPAQPLNPANFLGNALSGGNTNRAAGNAAMAVDLVSLLSHSLTQIDQMELAMGNRLDALSGKPAKNSTTNSKAKKH